VRVLEVEFGAALEPLEKLVFDIAICNAEMEGQGKFELLDQIRVIQPALPVIVGAARRGAFQYFEKPFDIEQLLGFIEQAFEES